MGLLSEGTPLSWEETKAKADHVREHGITQFINLWKRHKDVKKDCLLWGDEVEYTLVHLDHENEKSSLLLKGDKVLHVLQQQERENPADLKTIWRPEYANYMVEGTPGKPYGGLMAYFNMVEANMRRRRKEVMRLLSEPGETALSVVTFPRLGCPNFSRPEFPPTPTEGASRSLFYPEEVIFPGHPRFKTLTRNIRQRRGEKVAINIPIFKDKNTPSPFQEDLSQYGDSGESQAASLPDHIYLDAMGFGMGCSCLQMTFQACNIDEARHLYDQLAPLCPIIMALSAGSPIYRGFLSDIDCRWFVISNSVDCRTREERGLEPLQKDRFRIHKSRYDTIDSYLGPCNACYNDIDMVYDRDICSRLKAAGVDELLARHVAHLFIRDPISLFSEKIDQNDEEESDHFENIQSTNWQSMRFKPPPPNSDIGWRVEFRPTEVQLTDFENAAYVVFVVLLTRVILSFHLNLVIPISKVDQNMKTAAKRDALRQGKFYFKKDLLTGYSPPKASECICNCPCGNVDISRAVDAEDEYTEMTINEIINGKVSNNL
ncbi:glutamate--cysteine ligase catalytic subunit-like [Lingula anatina]|uniref:Glutamate--cysteine ligase n=1 Tax=Lingula anatina TaxID=7574 RepID=A0A2R2MQ40_LINAN|nr:glutamate--cysteine ligase catalytic subunit-like [Lingula anatina]|eukprot:XP_023932288.1 glutamate--cysteine ligase catalytic subunit-like [Lingula anatina]